MKSFTKAYEVIVNNFHKTVYAFFLYVMFLVITLFSLIGVYLLLSGIILIFGNLPSYVYFSMVGLMSVVFLFLASGFKGAYIKMVYNILKNENVKTISFVYFALKFAHKFFAIGLSKTLVLIIGLSPLMIIYLIDASIITTSLIGQILIGVYVFGIVFVVFYSFSLSYILTSLFGYGVKRSIIGSVKLALKHAPIFVPLYLIYILSVIIGFIPILNFLSWFILYPSALMALMIETINHQVELR